MAGSFSPLKSVLLITAGLLLASAHAGDWPQWRGPERDGVWREEGVLKLIPSTGLKIRWRARVAGGYAGPVVASGKVFVFEMQTDPQVERIQCFDEATGELLWVHSYPCDYAGLEYGSGPRAAPTIGSGKVYSLGAMGHLFCLDENSGAVIWKKDLVSEYDALAPRWGISAAPILVGDSLIICAGGRPDASVIAFHKDSGNERWRALSDGPGYSAPLFAKVGVHEQVIVWTGDNIAGLDPESGEIFWQEDYKTIDKGLQTIASPVLYKDRLLCLGAFGGRSVMLKLNQEKPEASMIWTTKKNPSTMFSTPVFREDDHFYATLLDGRLACLSASTGEEVWTTEKATALRGGMNGTAHLTPHDDHVFLFNQKGHLILAKLSPGGYEELGRCWLLEPTASYRAQRPFTWAHPAYANRCIFVRNDRELICASLDASVPITTESIPEESFPLVEENPSGSKGFGSADRLAISHDGKYLAKSSSSKIKILEWETASEVPAPLKHRYPISSIRFSPDDKFLVTVGGTEWLDADGSVKQDNAEVVIWDMSSGKERVRLKELHSDKVTDAVFSPDGKILATCSADHTIKLLDAETLKVRFIIEGHTDAVSSLAFSPDGALLASAAWDNSVRFWNPETGQGIGSLKNHPEEIRALAFSPDGKLLATGCADWSIRLWDVKTKSNIAVLSGHKGSVYCLAFSPDGKTLASGSGDQTVKIWDIPFKKIPATLRSHQSRITALAFSPDGNVLVSSGADDSIKRWKLERN